jgi:capsular polysaccharide biosynthesis protein
MTSPKDCPVHNEPVAREFWIDDILNIDRPYMRAAYIHEQDSEKCIGNTIHVIEYSAVEKLKDENEQLKEKLELVAKALKLYVSRSEHSCNIEYGNNVGVERCVKCNGIKALEKMK